MNRPRLSTLVLAALVILSAGPPLSAQAPASALIDAINNHDEPKAARLLEQGADPNARDLVTQPAITAAAYFGLEKTVQALLARGADTRLVDNDGAGALHAAALGGHAGVVRVLLDRGLAVNEPARVDGMTPMAYAAVRGHLSVMRALLKRHADVNLADSGGNSPLLHAAMRGRTDAVRLLLESGAKVDAASKHGWTPLMAAAWEGHTSVVTDLLTRGANATLVNAERRSALMLAESEGHRVVVELLTARRAADPRVRVLILDGYSNHDWRLTTALIRGMLEPTGLFTVDVATAPPTADAPGWDSWRPAFANYDVVIQTCNDLGGGPPWPQPVRDAFEAFVRNGGGVYVWHGGNNAFPDWPAYNEMIGLGWRKKDFGPAVAVAEDGTLRRIPAGEGPDTGHGARIDTVVHRRGDHPIHAGLPRAWLTPDIEVYYYARGPAERLEVLSYGFDPKTEMRWPLEWTTTYGRGRVYTSTFGHVWKGDTQPARMRCAGLQTVVARALQWLAGRAVTAPIPSDFPTADRVSVRPEIALPGGL